MSETRAYMYVKEHTLKELAMAIERENDDLYLVGKNQEGEPVIVTIWRGSEEDYDENGTRISKEVSA